MVTQSLSLDLLNELAVKAGVNILAVSPIEDVVARLGEEPALRLRLWQDAGHGAEMSYMMRPPELLADPRKLLSTARSIISLRIPYCQDVRELQISDSHREYLLRGEVPEGYGRVARYAWGEDYHKVIKRRLLELVKELSTWCSTPIQARVFVDAVPLLERSVAVLASGPGTFIGRNAMLIQQGVGSFFFLAEVLCDIEFRDALVPSSPNANSQSSAQRPGSGCGSCQRCIVSCPTGALLGKGMLDSRKCISYLTIEKKGLFSDAEAEAIGSWLFGCDECQDICPFNHRCIQEGRGIREGILDEFACKGGVGPFLSIDAILGIASEAEFRFKFAGSPVLRTGRTGLVRNTLALLANKRYFHSIPVFEKLISGDESDDIRFYARYVLARLMVDADGTDRLRIETILRRTERCLGQG